MMNVRRVLAAAAAMAICLTHSQARDYYVATNGQDSNAGTIEAPLGTLAAAIGKVVAGDVIYVRGGTYKVQESEIMNTTSLSPYACVYYLSKSGSADKPICIYGYPGERPVFDFSAVKPSGMRIIGFCLKGNYWHLKNFDIVGVQVTVTGHTQSECISARGGSWCTVENIAMHDGMAIGYYQTAGHNNTVLNCDAYNNYDDFSEGVYGGNTDGFGGHVTHETDTDNAFIGCRAWYNSDDGFDLINNFAAFTIDHCWAFKNGYAPNSYTGVGDGTGIKAGGYGMSASPKVPSVIPMNKVSYCIAYDNRLRGFYANHHLGGLFWQNNSSYANPENFRMVNRDNSDLSSATDVEGYGHILKNNMSFAPKNNNHLTMCNQDACSLDNNTFGSNASVTLPSQSSFLSIDWNEMTAPRQDDGSLPEIGFLKAVKDSQLALNKIGWAWEEAPSAEMCVPMDECKFYGSVGSIVVECTKPTMVCLYDMSGRLVLAKQIQGPSTICGLKNGLYVVNGQKVLVR